MHSSYYNRFENNKKKIILKSFWKHAKIIKLYYVKQKAKQKRKKKIIIIIMLMLLWLWCHNDLENTKPKKRFNFVKKMFLNKASSLYMFSLKIRALSCCTWTHRRMTRNFAWTLLLEKFTICNSLRESYVSMANLTFNLID